MDFYKKQLIGFLLLILLCISSNSFAQWIRKGSTGGLSIGESVAVDNSGNVYSTGTFFCSLVFDGDTLLNPTCTDLTGIPRYDGFVVKYDGNGILQWAKQITGEKTKTLSIKGISTDNSGNCYITGYYTGTLTFGSTVITNNKASQDMFVARYLSNGTFDWVQNNFARATTSFIQANTIAVDNAGNSFVAGTCKDSIIFGNDTLLPTKTKEFFIAKFNSAGTYQWSIRSLGDSNNAKAEINDLALDMNDHLYVTGTFKDTILIGTGKYIRSGIGQNAMFLIRYSDPPSLDWSKVVKEDNLTPYGISLDKDKENVFVAGQYKGLLTSIGTDILPSTGTDYGAFVAKYDTLGNFDWSGTARVTSGDSCASAKSVGVDDFGAVYMAGSFGKKNSTSSVRSGSITKAGYTDFDGFVAKYDSVGTIKWIQTLGGSLNDDVRDIYAKDSSNIYIAGYFSLRMRVDSMLVTNDSTGGFNSYTAEMDVCPYYSADITATGATTFCKEDSVLLTATAGAGFTYQWLKNDVIIAGATSATYYAKDSAYYRVRITNPSIPCVKYSTSKFITVYSLPNVTVSKNDTTVFCTGGQVRLSVPLGNKYQWLESGNIIAAKDTNFSYTATTSGNYSVIARNLKGCKDTSVVTAVTVIPFPIATVAPSGKFIICNGDSVTLNSNTSAGYKYQWLKNNAVLVNDTLSVYKAKTTGIYKIKISNQLGCSTTSTTADTITVITTPPATISVSGSNTYCSYTPSTLLANTGINLKYKWEFNNTPLLAADTLSSYFPLASGNYTVKVRNTTGCEATSSSVSITINTPPTASISAAGATSFCNGDSVRLNASTGTGYTYLWQRNGVTISGANNSFYYGKTTGNYRVLVTAPNTCSDTSSIITITIHPIPTSTITVLGTPSFCVGDSVELKANSGTGFSYVWKNGGIPIASANSISYKAKTAGTYTVEITNASNCSKESSSLTVTVFTVPPANITASGLTTFCDGDSVTLQANTGMGFTYNWMKNGFTISSATTSSLKVKNAGSYTVKVSITNTCTNTSSATSVTVKPNQQPVITVNGTNISTSFFNSYQWKLNGNPISGATNQIYDAVANGQYTVTVQNTNACISSSEAITVCVPAPYITTSGSLLKASDGSAWQWYLDNIQINGATSKNYFAQASGNYTVKVRDNSSCESFSIPVLVCVPSPTITLGPNGILTASSGVSYQWYLDEIEIVGANTQVYIAESNGSYTVKVEDINSCESVSIPLSVTITGNTQSMNAAGILVYPNPFNELFSISFKNNLTGIMTIEILDLPGNVLLKNKLNKESYEFESSIEINNLPAGAYLLRITDNSNNKFIQKINKTND